MPFRNIKQIDEMSQKSAWRSKFTTTKKSLQICLYCEDYFEQFFKYNKLSSQIIEKTSFVVVYVLMDVK